MLSKIVLMFIVLILPKISFAAGRDVVELKNGSVIKGTVLEAVPGKSVKIETNDGSIFVYKMSEVLKISKDEEERPARWRKRQEQVEEEEWVGDDEPVEREERPRRPPRKKVPSRGIVGLRGAWVFPSNSERKYYRYDSFSAFGIDLKLGWEWKFFGVSTGLDYLQRQITSTFDSYTYDSASGNYVLGNPYTYVETISSYAIPIRGEFLVPAGKMKIGMQLGAAYYFQSSYWSGGSAYISPWDWALTGSPLIVKMIPTDHFEIGLDVKYFQPLYTTYGYSTANLTDYGRWSIGLDLGFRL